MAPEASGRRVGDRSQAWLVFALIGVACLLNFVWLSYDKTPPHWDYAGHLLSTLRYRELLASFVHGGQQGFMGFLRHLVQVDAAVYPPLFHLAAALASPTMSLRSLVMVNSLFLAILVYCVYRIGRRLHSELAGVLTAVLILATPIAIHMSHEFMVDYALLAMTALSGFLLIESNEFRSPRETYLFGISVGLGLLTKPTFASFIAVPACYTLFRAAARAVPQEERPAQFRVLARLGLALLLGALLASLWYFPNRKGVYSEATRIAASNPIGFPISDVNAIVYYPSILVVDQIGLPMTILLIFGLVVLRKRVPPKDANLLLAWLVGIYVFAAIAPFKEYEQDIGILVPISVISAVGLAGLTRFRRTACAATLVFVLFQYIALGFPFAGLSESAGPLRWAISYHGFASREGWQIERALASLGKSPLTILVLSDDRYINGVTFEYYARSLGLPFKILGRYEGNSVDKILGADVVVFKSNWVPGATTRGASLRGVDTRGFGVMYTQGRCIDFRDRPNEPVTNNWTRRDLELEGRSMILGRNLVETFGLPDGSELLVYR